MKKYSLKSLKAKLWKLVSIHVRKSAADWRGMVECYTCGVKKPWTEMQCGHFKHGKLDYDLRNLKPQCPQCNMWKSGRLDVYAIKLVQQFGLLWVEQLEKDAAAKGNNYTRTEVEALLVHYKKQ